MSQRIDYENLIFILYLFNRLKVGGGRMRTAKLLYLLEDDLYKNKLIGPTYIMRRYQMGPYNPKIATDLRSLADYGFLNVKEKYYEKIDDLADIYTYNRKTAKFLKSIENLIEENTEIFDKLDTIVDIYSRKSGEELKDLIYSLEITGAKQKRIYDYSEREVILDPKKISNPIKQLELDEDWYDTIEILLNPELYYGLQRGIRDAQQGNFSNESI